MQLITINRLTALDFKDKKYQIFMPPEIHYYTVNIL